MHTAGFQVRPRHSADHFRSDALVIITC